MHLEGGASIVENGGLKFFAKHPALVDFAALLSEGLGHDFNARAFGNVLVFVGLHEFDREALPEKSVKIAIQTEQYFDEHGKKLWACPSFYFLLRQIFKYDLILDISVSNKKAYRFLPPFLRRKIVFGPFVFPDMPVKFHPGSDGIDRIDSFIFVGALSERRSQILRSISKSCSTRIEFVADVFGTALRRHVRRSMGVINIHYSTGIYTELPRFLLCYIEGKVMYSEQLAAPFVAERHYPMLNKLADVGTDRFKIDAAIFENISLEIASVYKFSSFIDQALRDLGCVKRLEDHH